MPQEQKPPSARKLIALAAGVYAAFTALSVVGPILLDRLAKREQRRP